MSCKNFLNIQLINIKKIDLFLYARRSHLSLKTSNFKNFINKAYKNHFKYDKTRFTNKGNMLS